MPATLASALAAGRVARMRAGMVVRADRPHDGDGDGFYSPRKGLPDKTPLPAGMAAAAAKKAGGRKPTAKAAPAKAAPRHPRYGEPLRRRTPRDGDVAVWTDPADGKSVTGRVKRVPARTETNVHGFKRRLPARWAIEWEGGRTETFDTLDPDVTLYAGEGATTPAKPAKPAKKTTGRTASISPAEAAKRGVRLKPGESSGWSADDHAQYARLVWDQHLKELSAEERNASPLWLEVRQHHKIASDMGKAAARDAATLPAKKTAPAKAAPALAARDSPERREQVKRYVRAYTAGASISEIADAAGVSYATVHKDLVSSGVQLRGRGAERRRTSDVQAERDRRSAAELARIREASGREAVPAKAAKATPAKATPRETFDAAATADALANAESADEVRQRLAAIRSSADLRAVAEAKGMSIPDRVKTAAQLRAYIGSNIRAYGGSRSASVNPADMPPTQLAARYSLSLEDAKLFADWLREHPGGSVTQWKASRRTGGQTRRLRDMTRLSDEALAAAREQVPEVGYSTNPETIAQALAKFNAADLLRIADAFNVTIPSSARTAEQRRGTIAFSAAQANRRNRGGI